jgi:hypothetical protein
VSQKRERALTFTSNTRRNGLAKCIGCMIPEDDLQNWLQSIVQMGLGMQNLVSHISGVELWGLFTVASISPHLISFHNHTTYTVYMHEGDSEDECDIHELCVDTGGIWLRTKRRQASHPEMLDTFLQHPASLHLLGSTRHLSPPLILSALRLQSDQRDSRVHVCSALTRRLRICQSTTSSQRETSACLSPVRSGIRKHSFTIDWR